LRGLHPNIDVCWLLWTGDHIQVQSLKWTNTLNIWRVLKSRAINTFCFSICLHFEKKNSSFWKRKLFFIKMMFQWKSPFCLI
jgi:hypothetical protein